MNFSDATPPAAVNGGGTTISAVHPDIIQTHILTRLDGPSLAAATCASTQLHSLSIEQKLWHDVCATTWPSIDDPTLSQVISTFPSGYRSFFSDAFTFLDHRSPASKKPELSSFKSELISAVDIKYQNNLVFSKIQKTDTVAGWFTCSAFRIDLLDPKDYVMTPIPHAGGNDNWLKHIEQNLTLSWIVFDPTRKRAVNLSSGRPVSVDRHWLTGELEVQYAVVMAGERRGASEYVEWRVKVTCGGKEGGEIQVREVSMVVEDMEGKIVNGKDGLGILEMAVEKGRRKSGKTATEGKERYEEYLRMKKDRKERIRRRESTLDMVSIAVGVSLFVAFWSFILFR